MATVTELKNPVQSTGSSGIGVRGGSLVLGDPQGSCSPVTAYRYISKGTLMWQYWLSLC